MRALQKGRWLVTDDWLWHVESCHLASAMAGPAGSSAVVLVPGTGSSMLAGGSQPDRHGMNEDNHSNSSARRTRRCPNLTADSIIVMRERQRQLREQSRNLRQDLRNARRRRARVLTRLRHLDTASVLQVLSERGLDLAGQGTSLQPPRNAAVLEIGAAEVAAVENSDSETLSLAGREKHGSGAHVRTQGETPEEEQMQVAGHPTQEGDDEAAGAAASD